MLYALGGYFIRFLRILYRMLTLRLKQIRSSRASIHSTYGKNTRIGSGSVVTDDVIIGNYTYINTGSTAEYCTIGSYCSISSGVRINPWEHNLSAMSTSPSLGGSNKDLRKRVFIDDDCLISANVIELSGSHLGQGSVIAAGAVVTHDVRPYEIVGGVPAKHIGWRFDEQTRSRLCSVDIRNLDPEEAGEKLKQSILN